YTTHLNLARRSQERQHAIGVCLGEEHAITALMRADNDVPAQVLEEGPESVRVLFEGHDGIFRLRREHPEFARMLALLTEAAQRSARVWFIAQKPDLMLLDVIAGWGN